MKSTSKYQRTRRRHIFFMVLAYILLFFVFFDYMYWQTGKVNTLDFAPGQLTLTTSKTKYTVGDPISYTIANGLSKTIDLVNSCPKEPLHVYQWTNNSWNRIHDTAKAGTCSTDPKLSSLAPGKSVTLNYDNWPNLFKKPGIYRIVILATNYPSVPYADFQVVAAPVKPAAPTIIYQKVYTPVYTPIYIPAPSGGGGDGGGGGDN